MKQEGQKKIGKTIGLIVGALAFALTFYGAQQLFKKDLEAELKQAVTNLNKETPIQVDQFSRLDSASSIGKTNIIYYFSIIGMEKSEINLDTVNKYIRPSIVENVKNSPDLKTFRDNNITMDYKYYDKNGDFTMEISVTPDQYKTD